MKFTTIYARPTIGSKCMTGYKLEQMQHLVNLPGTEDTVINKAVPSCGGPGIALSWVEACDCPKRGQLGCAIFGSGGLRSRVPLFYYDL